MTPRCPYCNAQGLGNLALQRLELFGLVYCNKCGAIYGVISLPQPEKISPLPAAPKVEPVPPIEATQPAPKIQPKPPSGPLAEIGNADFSHKTPYDPVEIANRARAAGLGRGSHYLQIAIDDGPPYCPTHHVEMTPATIPPGYKNAGQQVWLCPQFKDCHQWEIVKS